MKKSKGQPIKRKSSALNVKGKAKEKGQKYDCPKCGKQAKCLYREQSQWKCEKCTFKSQSTTNAPPAKKGARS